MTTGRTRAQVTAAGITGAIMGGAGGAAFATALGLQWAIGLVVGGLVLGTAVAWTDAHRVPGRPQPLWSRVMAAVFLAATLGWLLESILPDWPAWAPCAAVGAMVGMLGFRPARVVLGAVIGALVGSGFQIWQPAVGWAIPVAITVLAYRLLSAALWQGRDQVEIMGEEMDPADTRYVVPFAEMSGHVGVDYLERHAARIGATFSGRPPDIGIVEDFDLLAGPEFDPSLVHPLIREFYEHTSRFSLSIVPEWKRWMRIPYRIYRATIARPLGQANAPFEIEDVQRGIQSWIDTLDLDDDGTADVRAWVRAYEDGQPLYVGIYTVQHIDDIAYVAVGFPLPAGSFTATLLPANHDGDGLLLSSASPSRYSGHYLSHVSAENLLTTIRLVAFGEEIDVFVTDGKLYTEHRFTLGGFGFLTLHYVIDRKITP